VLKTVAYVVVDEDFDGNPIVEKWHIKDYEKYVNPDAEKTWNAFKNA